MSLGLDLDKVMINFNTLKVTGTTPTTFTQKDFFFKDDELFLESNFFSNILLKGIEIDYGKTQVSMISKYTLPDEIVHLFKSKESDLQRKKEINDFLYTNARELFNLGYMRVNLDKTFTKNEGNEKHDWDGFLEYQGPLFYGEFTAE